MKNSNEQNREVRDKVRKTIDPLKSDEINLYRIFVEQTRQLHSDVWNGVRFFLTINAIIIAAMAALYASITDTGEVLWLEMALAVIGILFTLVGMFILSRHRDYYLDGLMRKTLLEYTLGLYEQVIAEIDLVLPWSVPKKYVEQELLRDPKAWKKKHKWRPGTISRKLRFAYMLFLAIYVIAFAVVLFLVLLDP